MTVMGVIICQTIVRAFFNVSRFLIEFEQNVLSLNTSYCACKVKYIMLCILRYNFTAKLLINFCILCIRIWYFGLTNSLCAFVGRLNQFLALATHQSVIVTSDICLSILEILILMTFVGKRFWDGILKISTRMFNIWSPVT